MNLCIDFDQTIVYNNLIASTSKELGYFYKHSDVRDWYFSTFPRDFRVELYKRFEQSKYMVDNLTIINGVIDKLNQWKRDKHKIYIITARSEKIRKDTIKFASSNFNMIDKLYFVDIGESKENYWKKLKCDIWIDDNPNDIESACKLNIKTYCINNKYTKYNNYLKLLKLNIDFVHSVADINL